MFNATARGKIIQIPHHEPAFGPPVSSDISRNAFSRLGTTKGALDRKVSVREIRKTCLRTCIPFQRRPRQLQLSRVLHVLPSTLLLCPKDALLHVSSVSLKTCQAMQDTHSKKRMLCAVLAHASPPVSPLYRPPFSERCGVVA